MLHNVNKDLAPIKAHYFFFNAATGPIVQFLPTIAKQLNFSGTLLGTVYTVLPISGLIAKPIFGGLADKFKLHKTFFLIFQVILVISLFMINFIPETTNVVFTCNGPSFLEVCSEESFSEKIINSVIIPEENQYTRSCEVSCEASQRAYEELCHWNAQEYCYPNNSLGNTFKFTAEILMSKNMNVQNCIYLLVDNATLSDGSIHVPVCEKQLRTPCIASCHDSNLNQLLQKADASHIKTSTYQFQLFLWASIVSWICMAVVVSIADAICFNLLGIDKRQDYGKQRMWGSIGFGIFSISAGYLVDVFSKGELHKNYTCIFYIMLFAMIFDILVSSTLKKKNPDCSEEPCSLWEVFAIAKEAKVIVFGWWCIGAGMCTAVVWNFLFWYMEDLTDSSHIIWLKTIQGFVTGIQTFLGELPFNFMSGSLLKKFGHVNIMSLVLLIYAIRFMAYSVVSNPLWFLFIEILHGPTLGLCWPTMVSYGDKITPPGTKATIQGLIGAIFEGIGVASGSLLCGWLLDSYGGVTAFRIFSVGALLWLSVFWLMQLLLRKLKVYPIHQGHNHLASYANPDDAILMTISQELQRY